MPGVLVGHATLIVDEPRVARTGVTMIVPRDGSIWGDRVFGGFFSQLRATGWSLSGSLEGGLEWSAPGSAQRVRALVVAQRGALPFSQFFTDRTQSFGLQMQFEF